MNSGPTCNTSGNAERRRAFRARAVERGGATAVTLGVDAMFNRLLVIGAGFTQALWDWLRRQKSLVEDI